MFQLIPLCIGKFQVPFTVLFEWFFSYGKITIKINEVGCVGGYLLKVYMERDCYFIKIENFPIFSLRRSAKFRTPR